MKPWEDELLLDDDFFDEEEDAEEQIEETGLDPVSYTHLTLPTIIAV